MRLYISPVVVGLVIAGAVVAPPDVNADDTLFDFDTIFSGSTPPAAPPPWITATFQDVSGGVLLSIAAPGLSGTEFLSRLYFNLDPAYELTGPMSLNFGPQNQTGSFDLPTISQGYNAFKAGGEGWCDILFTFSTRHGDQHRFMSGDSVSYLISGMAGLEVSDFCCQSTGRATTLYAAARVQAIAGDQSLWLKPSEVLPIPEPDSLILVTLAAACCSGVGLTRRSHGRRGF